MLDGLNIFNLKSGIHSSVLGIKTFLYNIRKPRYKQIKMAYQILKILDIGQSSILNSGIVLLLFRLPYVLQI